MDIDTLLTVTQKLQIQTIIKRQCDVYARIEEINNELYYEPYTKSRKRHDITAAVISGFRPGATEINDCIISECRYGRGYAQPEINTGKVILHIYSQSNDLNSKLIKEYCARYNENLDKYPIYGLIIYEVNKESYLEKLNFLIFDHKGTKHKESIIYKRTNLSVISA